MIWIPEQELKFYKEHQNKVKEDAKNIDWVTKCFMQMKFEKGHYDDLEPILREDLRTLAYE